jgi:predicted lipid-binding transport protein (Tim44 family)
MQLDPVMIIFAFLAVFVLWKLRSVLGERTGLEGEPDRRVVPFPAPAAPPPVNDARWADFAERGSPVWAGLDDIARAQSDFAPRAFLAGASAAYELVVQAFSRGDEDALRSLASEEVFSSFKGALDERKRRGETLETTFVGFNSVRIAEARVERPNALIAVRFDSQFVTVTRDANGAVLEGDPTQPSNIVDVWTFARRNDASTPNWTLVATTPAQ